MQILLKRVQLSSLRPGQQFFQDGYWYTVLKQIERDDEGCLMDAYAEIGLLTENGLTKFSKSSSDYVKILDY